MKYFDHDTEAYKDDKIVLLRRECGGAAVDAYWTLLELIYREETELKPTKNPLGYASVSFFLQCDESQLEEWIAAMCKYGLLECSEDDEGYPTLMSPRAAENIDGYKSRCQRNYANGSKGGRPRKTPVQDGQGKNSKTEQKPNQNPNETQTKPTENQRRADRLFRPLRGRRRRLRTVLRRRLESLQRRDKLKRRILQLQSIPRASPNLRHWPHA